MSTHADEGKAIEPFATVCVTVDFDAASLWMQWGARGAISLSRGEFGARVGAPRLLDLFARRNIPTTWFIPGHTAETWPEVTAAVAACGHEIGNHGYLHESFDKLTIDEARSTLLKSNDALRRVTGQKPHGFRHPTGDSTGELQQLLLEIGFDYDSSLMAGDFFPYWCRGPDVLFDDAPITFGPTINLVEIPDGFLMSDFHHLEFNYGEPLLVGHDAPSAVEEIWCGQFDYMYTHCPGGTLNLIVHPECIGQGLHMAMLERFIEHCASHAGTRFAKLETVAAEFRARSSNPESGWIAPTR